MKISKLNLLLIAMCSSYVSAAESSKIFKSYEAEYKATVIVSPAEKKGFYYISFKGFEHDYDNSSLLYKKVKNSDGVGVQYQLSGMNNINFKNNSHRTMINGTSIPYSEVFLDNDSITRVIYSGKADIVQERKVKQEYLDRQLTAISKVEAKSLISSAQKSFSKSCDTRVKLNISWSDFSKKGLKTTPAKTAAYFNALEKICAIDSDYFDAVKSITNIKISLSNDNEEHHAQLNGKTLTLEIGDQVPNIPETSYKLLYNIF